MFELRQLLSAALTADTLTSTVAAGSPSATVVQLEVGEAATWERGDVIHVLAPAAANDRRVTRVTDTDTGLDRVTVSPALAATPAAGQTLGGGVLEWAGAASRIVYRRPTYSSPVEALIADPTISDCAILFGQLIRTAVAFTADRERWELRAISRDPTWAEGAAHRLRKLFHRQAGALSSASLHVGIPRIETVEERERDDALHEWVAQLELVLAEVPA